MMSDKKGWYLVLAASLLAAGVFIVDLWVELGHADWVIYMAAFLLAAQVLDTWGTVVFVGVCSVLTLAGYYLAPHGLEPAGSLLGRTVGMGVFWVVAWLVISGRRTRQAKQNHAILKALLNSPASGMICVKDRQGKVILANQAMLRMLGRTEADVVGKDDLDSLPDGERVAQIRANDRRVMEEGFSLTSEETIDSPGRRWTCLFHKSPLRDAKGNVVGIIGVAVDISELRNHQAELEAQHHELQRMQGALEESRDKYLDLYDSAPVGYFTLTRKGRVAEANRTGASLLGIDRAQLVGRGLGQFVVLEDIPRWDRHLLDASQGSGRQTCELTFLRPDGSTFYARLESIRLDASGGEDATLRVAMSDVTDRMRAERDLAASESKYRRLHETMTDAFVLVGMDGWIQEFNKAYQDMLGYEPDEICRLTYLDLTPPKWHEFESEIVREQILPRGHSEVYCKEYRRKDGSVFPVELRTFLLRDEAGQPVGMWALVRDVTEREAAASTVRQAREDLEVRVQQRTAELSQTVAALQQEVAHRLEAESALRESEQRYRQLFATVPDAVTAFDAQTGMCIDMNQAAQQMFGYSAGEIHAVHVVAVSAEPEKTKADFPGIVAGRRIVRIPLRQCRRKDGTVFPAEASVGTFVVGGRQVVCGVFRDITERMLAEQKVCSSEAMYRALVETTDTGYLIMDSRGRVVDANAEYVRMTGHVRLEEILGRSVVEWTAPYDQQRNATEVVRCVRQGSVRDLRIDYVDRQGNVTPTEIQATVVPSGQDFQIIAISRDITRRVARQEAVRQAQVALQSAHRKLMTAVEDERRRLALELHDSVAQDLLALELSLRNTASGLAGRAEQSETAKVLQAAVGRCNQAVREIRGICHGLYPPSLEVFGLASSLGQLVAQCTEAGLAGQLHVADEAKGRRFGPDVEIAVFRSAQEAVNNALRHSRAKGLCLDLGMDDGKLVLTVKDDGQGFQPGSKASPGLGLVSMRERAEAVGGDLQIDSHSGGTTVSLHVPVEPV